MIKVVVVEDEPPILNAVANMIEKTNSHFHVVGKARDGEDALALIETLKPDVVFTDVRMPVMDGLSLIERLSSFHPEIITIILSGYKEFEYARKALKFGVYDYLIKPLHLDLLKELLDKIFLVLMDVKKRKEFDTLEMLMNNTTPVSSSSSHKSFEIFDYKEFLCILICTGSYCSYHSSLLTPGNHFWALYNMDEYLSRIMTPQENFWVLDGEHSNEKIILIGSTTFSDYPLKTLANEVYRQIVSPVIPLTAVISEVFNNIKHFTGQVQKLQKVLKKYIVFGMPQLISENNLTQILKRTDSEVMNPTWETFFNNLIINRQYNGFKQNIKSLLALCEEYNTRQFILEKVLQQIYGLFCYSPELKPSDKLIDIHMEINELITYSTSYMGLSEGLFYLLDDLFDNYFKNQHYPDNQEEIINRVDEYIQLNYSKPINLQTLAGMYGFVPQYLSRKYKKIKGITPNDYITKLRIEKAKELLLTEPPISVKDIAVAVGYEDPFYLSRIFKIVTGKSPSEFRSTGANC